MELLTVVQANKITNIHESTLKEWLSSGILTRYESDTRKNLIDKLELLKKIPTVICLFNLKGGVGKTTTSRELINYFATVKDMKVLAIDIDPQANLTNSFIDMIKVEDNNQPTLYNYLEYHTSLNKVVITISENIDILPSDLRLDTKIGLGIETVESMRDDFNSLFKKYNIIIIDCPPSFNGLSKIGLMFANYIFIPVLAEQFSYNGVYLAFSKMREVIYFNKSFIDFKVYISKQEWNKTSVRQFFQEKYKKEIGDNFLESSIPNFIGLVEAQKTRANIFEEYKNTDSVKKIIDFCQEIERIIYDERGK